MRPIKITEQNKKALLEQFTLYLNNAKLSNNTVEFSTKLINNTTVNTPKATVRLTAQAYAKILMYVRDTTTEIAWHGTVHKEDNIYTITDVFLYPQKLSAATVTTDQEKYNKWIEELDDETYNHLRFQGHSHVNFGVSPSGTDLAFYDSILQVLSKDDFYIFMIINKTGSMTFLIYDLAQNLIYETEDIEIHIGDTEENMAYLIDLEKETYCEKPISVHCTGTYNYNSPRYAQTPYTGRYNEQYTEVDEIFDSIDARFGKSTLESKPKKGTKKK